MYARKLLLLPTVIVGDFFESCHMAEAEDYRYIIDVFQAWAGSQPCWKANEAPKDISHADKQYLYAYGVRW